VGYRLAVAVGSLALVAAGATGDYGIRVSFAFLVVFSPVVAVVALAGGLVPPPTLTERRAFGPPPPTHEQC
jgi:hypothetical protein